MMTPGREISLIIPTLARRPELLRAIDSVTGQVGCRAIPIVVVNGRHHDQTLMMNLRNRSDIRLHETERPGVSNARFVGRNLVDTEFFGFLDDDDELLPQALAYRCGMLEETGASVIATNGFVEENGRRSIMFEQLSSLPDDPAKAILSEAWFSSYNCLFWSPQIGAEYFDGLPDFLEWTYLGFKLAHSHKIIRVEEPTFVRHIGASDQVSQSWTYLTQVPRVLAQMVDLTPREDLRDLLHRNRTAALHDCSEAALDRGNLGVAWRYHLQSLLAKGGVRYLSYTRHLLSWPFNSSLSMSRSSKFQGPGRW